MSEQAIRHVPFPEAGEGVELFFRTRDFLELQKKFGADYIVGAQERVDKSDLEYIGECIRLGCKKDGKPFAVSLDALDDVSLHVVGRKVLDALFLRLTNKTFEEHVKSVMESLANGENASPQTSPAISSPTLESAPSAPDSSQASSGTQVQTK